MRVSYILLCLFFSFSLLARDYSREYPKFSLFTPHRVEPFNCYGDGLLFSRSNPPNRLLAYDNVTGNRAFETSLIHVASHFGYQFGTDFFLTTQSRFVLDFAHGHWDQLVVKVTPNTSVISPFFNSHVSRTQTHFLSKLSIGELNYQYTVVDGLALLAGFRYLYERENTEIFQSFPNAISNLEYNISAINRAGIVQIGGEVSTTLKELINFDFALKMGAGVNFAEQRSWATLTSFFSGSKKKKEKNQGIICIELDLLFRYEVTSKLFIRAGYDALFVSGLASSVDNLSQTPLRASNINTQGLTDIGINASSQVVYTKSYAGVEYRW